jgi:hypothetical protein
MAVFAQPGDVSEMAVMLAPAVFLFTALLFDLLSIQKNFT